MMRLQLILVTILSLLTSCGQRSTQTETSVTVDSSANTPITIRADTLCFLEVTGRDTTSLQLIINGTTVSGELAILPFEKDRARGSIRGKQTGNQILADWQRSGEGVTQSYEVRFTLKGDAITWREGKRIEKQGKWVLANPAQSYEYVLMKTACR